MIHNRLGNSYNYDTIYCMALDVYLPKQRPNKTIHAFCDESSQSGHQFLVFGAIHFAVNLNYSGDSAIIEIENILNQTKKDYGFKSDAELKWSTVPSSPGKYLEGYKKFVDFYLGEQAISFRCFILDTHAYSLKNSIFMNGDPELGYLKFLCVFLSDGLMKNKEEYYFKIRLDKKVTRQKYKITDLEDATNARFKNKSSQTEELCFEHCCIIPLESKLSPLLQVTDLLTGATAAKWNNQITSKGKLALLHYIEDGIGRNLQNPTGPLDERLNIWYFKRS
jgi:hypothetical protein